MLYFMGVGIVLIVLGGAILGSSAVEFAGYALFFGIPILKIISLFYKGEHNAEIKEIEKGERARKKEVKPKGKLNNFELGYSVWNGEIYDEIHDKMLNRMMAIIGTNGSGKTTTLSTIYNNIIILKNGEDSSPLIVVDGKPDRKKIAEYRYNAEQMGKKFYGFNCENNYSFDFINNGTPTTIKDKLMGLKNDSEWSNDFYKGRAEVYLQTAVEVIKEAKGYITLDDLIDCFDYEVLKDNVSEDISPKLKKKLDRIKDIDLEQLAGIRDQLILLSHSDLGEWLSSGAENEFTLNEVIEDNAVLYFALPGLKYKSFAKVIGKLVVNDLKSILDDYEVAGTIKPIYCMFDEFGVFAGEQVVDLLNKGRGLGIRCIIGMQSLADIKVAGGAGGDALLDQVMGNINTMLIHTIGDSFTANYLADKIGNMERKKIVKNVDNIGAGSELGATIQLEETHIIQPQEMKELPQGVGFITSTVFDNGLEYDKIRISYYEDFLQSVYDCAPK